MSQPLKYAVVERERRFLLARVPSDTSTTVTITDRYVAGTRLRLRSVVEADGSVVRKLTQKVRLNDGPAEVACTNLYLDDAEWALLAGLPGLTLTKTRHLVSRDGLTIAVDVFSDGSIVAEIDDGAADPAPVPGWLDVVMDVSADEAWTGIALAARLGT